MREIELINTSQILKELDIEIKSYISENGSSNDSEYWSDILKQLSSNHKEYISWSNIDMHDDIDQLVALFLLLDLPTRFLLKNKDFEKHLYDSHNFLATRIQELFLDSAENMALINSAEVRVTDGWGNETNNIDVAGFINWSLHSAGFIKLIENKSAIKTHNKTKKSEFQQEIINDYMQICLENSPNPSKRDLSICISEFVKTDERFSRPLDSESIRKLYLKNYNK
jgi:hypothetical protein